MIVKNEYVKINTDKEIVLHNYLYDIYLKLICENMYKYSRMGFAFEYCFVKFDTPFDDITNKTFDDFSIAMYRSSLSTNKSNSSVEANYTFTPSYVEDYEKHTMEYDLSKYNGRKITAIGFGLIDRDPDNYGQEIIGACLDTSNYSIYWQDNISFQRKDIITSDTIGKADNLSPTDEKTTIITHSGEDIIMPCYTKLYSIGLGTRVGVMNVEYVIGTDIDIIEESDTSFGFNLRKGLEPNKYPTSTTYTGNLYPLPLKVSKEILPNVNLYPGNGKYPMLSDYKYIIYKYKYYYFDGRYNDYIDLNEYFTMSLPNDTKGLFEIVTKIERSDV